MIKKITKLLACLLITIMVFNNVTINVCAAGSDEDTITVDGYTFEILQNSDNLCKIKYNDGNYTYTAELNKNTNKVRVLETEKIFIFNKEVNDYSIDIIKYDENNINYSVTDNNSHKTYTVSDDNDMDIAVVKLQ